MEELEKMAAQLMAAVRKLPPGQQRQDALREIGSRIYELLAPLSGGGAGKSAPASKPHAPNDNSPNDDSL
jgi:hypothetical protein